MGRFDLLTNLEEKTQKAAPGVSSPIKENQEKASLLANQQASKDANQQSSLLVSQQTSKRANRHASKLVNQQTSKPALSTKDKKKYGTYLREDSILEIQIHAARARQKDHELLQEIVDYYFGRNK